MKKLWDKGYELNKLVDSFTVNNDNELDEKLIYFDCIASLAHAKMLFAMKLITKERNAGFAKWIKSNNKVR